jgi:phosphate acetyltransferase
VRSGDKVTATITAKEKRDDKKIVVFGCEVTNQAGEVVLSGNATVIGDVPLDVANLSWALLP